MLKISLPFCLPTRECCISFPLGFISLLERLTFLEIVHSLYLRFPAQEHGAGDPPPVSRAPPGLPFHFCGCCPSSNGTGLSTVFYVVSIFIFMFFFLFILLFLILLVFLKEKHLVQLITRFCSFAFCSNDECYVYIMFFVLVSLGLLYF